MSSEIAQFHLPYLGTRAYLHGTTMFDSLLPLVPTDASMVIKFSHLVQTDRIIVRNAEEPGSSPSAQLTWKRGGESGSLFVYPGPASDVPQRRPYDEEAVSRQAELGSDFVRLEKASQCNFVATLIPLQKTLLAQCLPSPKPRRWLFVRLDLATTPPPDFVPLELKLLPHASPALARSEIRVGNKPLGVIYFAEPQNPSN